MGMNWSLSLASQQEYTEDLEGALDVVFSQVIQLKFEEVEELHEVDRFLLIEEHLLEVRHLLRRNRVAYHLKDLIEALFVQFSLE